MKKLNGRQCRRWAQGTLKWGGLGTALTVFFTWFLSRWWMLGVILGPADSPWVVVTINHGSLRVVRISWREPIERRFLFAPSPQSVADPAYAPHWNWMVAGLGFEPPAISLSVWMLWLPVAGVSARLLYKDHKSRLTDLCSSCSYDLTGNTAGLCPECGTRT